MNAFARAISPFSPDRGSKPLLQVLGLGAGVQSTTMALMAAHGEIEPMPDFCVFADTGAEPMAVYEHVAWMRSANLKLPFPIVDVRAGDLRMETLTSAREWQALSAVERADANLWKTVSRVANPPFFTRGPKATTRKIKMAAMPLFGEDEEVAFEVMSETQGETFGLLGRKCTRDYKINPIVAAIRAKLGIAPGTSGPAEPVVEQWIGITTDEAMRVRQSDVSFIRHRWPLIEKGMSRVDCYAWLRRNGYPIPPKSRCVFCPFQSDTLWMEMKNDAPWDFEAACEFDDAIRDGIRGTHHKLFVHRSCIPLREADFSRATPGGLLTGFIDECRGVCGI